MAEPDYAQPFRMNFGEFIEGLHGNLAEWDAAITGTIANRILKCFNALNRLHQKTVPIQRKRTRLARNNSVPKDVQAELLSEYDSLLELMASMRQWFTTIQEDYQELVAAREAGNLEEAREIEEELELEPGHI